MPTLQPKQAAAKGCRPTGQPGRALPIASARGSRICRSPKSAIESSRASGLPGSGLPGGGACWEVGWEQGLVRPALVAVGQEPVFQGGRGGRGFPDHGAPGQGFGGRRRVRHAASGPTRAVAPRYGRRERPPRRRAGPCSLRDTKSKRHLVNPAASCKSCPVGMAFNLKLATHRRSEAASGWER